MESPGEYLKREREIRGVTLGKIFEATRVPMKFLEALEADNYELMPHPTFIKGYIKTYCKALGLDETDAVLRFEVFFKEKNEKDHPQEARRPQPKKKQPSMPVALPKNLSNTIVYAGAGVLVLVIILYFAVGGRKEEPVPAVTEQAQVQPVDQTGPALPETAPAALVAPNAQNQPALTVEPPKAQPPVKAEAAPKTAVLPVSQPTAPVKDAKAAEPVKTEGVAAEQKLHSLTVNANEIAWIKIRIDNGAPFDVVLRQGESITWKANDLFSLILGNAGGVTLTHDGKKLSSLGKSGDVVSFKIQAQGTVQMNPQGFAQTKSKEAQPLLKQPLLQPKAQHKTPPEEPKKEDIKETQKKLEETKITEPASAETGAAGSTQE
ncbi:MAG: helix-turn-helix domain-containing protein [Deltaproteobacteria bacterium]|nr:helix-turn-helix domain-containing protein [Deltaproteobacteria bacterium]